MVIPDLKEFSPRGPSPDREPLSICRDGEWGEGSLPDETTLRAVGWLGDRGDSVGDVPDACIDKLFVAYEQELIFSDGYMGWHDCEMCSGQEQHSPEGDVGPVVERKGRQLRLYGYGHYLTGYEQTVFMAPALLLHYILDHRYKPPEPFVHAVIEGRFLTPDDLVFELPDA